MQRLLGAAGALSALASSAFALKIHGPQHIPGAHLHNLAGESFDVNQPGEHVLLRAPPESTKNPLLRVSGLFKVADEAPCPTYTETVIFKGDWLGKQTVRVSFLNGSLHIKVSSSSPPFVGPWRKIHNYTAAKHGKEAIPDSLKIMKTPDNKGFTFYAGTAKLAERPIIKVKQGFGGGLDVALANLKGFKVPKVAGLLGSYKHSKTVENRNTTCAANDQKMRKAVTVDVAHSKASSVAASSTEASTAVQSVQFRNLIHDKFVVRKPGKFVLLRVPTSTQLPALLEAQGYFVEMKGAPCVVLLDTVSLRGKWFGNRTVYVSSKDKTFGIKVSSPGADGTIRGIEKFVEASKGSEVLPSTVKITPEGRSFRFQLGPNKPSERANILVTEVEHGLNVVPSHMERTQVKEIGGLLGMDKYNKSLDTPGENCRLKQSSAEASSTEVSTAVQSVQFRNLAHEKFAVKKPGKFVLLRVPSSNQQPALMEVRGSFVVKGAPCVVLLDGVTFTGKWFGNKTVDLVDKTFGIKVSTAEKVGSIRSIEHFVEATTGPEALPSTVKILKEGRSFRFQVGTGKPSERANINVTQTAHGGLDVVTSHMERTQATKIGGLLGMDKHDTSLDTAPKNCGVAKAEAPAARVEIPLATVHGQSAAVGSLLTASWNA